MAGTHTGTTSLNSGGGNDIVSVQATSGLTMMDDGAGNNTVNVGSTAPATGGRLDTIQGRLTVTGGGPTTLNVDDTGSSAAKTGTLTPTALIGLGMVAGGITYSSLAALNIKLGSGGNVLAINDINPATTTTVDGGSSTNDSLTATFAQDFN